MTIAVVTDSSAQLGPGLAARFGARIVPVTVTIDGVEHLEGVDVTVDGFYQRLASSTQLPELTTTQPSAASFVAAFEDAISDGHQQVLAVVVGSAYSGAVNSAEVAARTVVHRHPEVAIDVVDSGTASFGIACAVWAAADAVAAGGGLHEARQAAIERAAVTSSVFVIDGLDLARRSGRFSGVDLGPADAPAGDEIPVLSSGPAGLEVVGQAAGVADTVDLMAGFIAGRGPSVVAAVGRAAPALDDLTDRFRDRLLAEPSVAEVVEYRVGPSIAAHTGPNTVGAFVFPVDSSGSVS